MTTREKKNCDIAPRLFARAGVRSLGDESMDIFHLKTHAGTYSVSVYQRS